MHDLVIHDAVVVDGTGGPRRYGSVAVDGGRVTAVGDPGAIGRRTIDAEGRVVCPGFIDVHTHYDVQAFWDSTLSPTPLHGVTTVVTGNCGFGVAPLRPEVAGYVMRLLAHVEDMPLESLAAAVPWDWGSTGEYLHRLDGTLAVNTGHLVGHSPLRAAVMGADANQRAASPDEIERMGALLAEGLSAGALGFSSSDSVTDLDGEGQPVPSRHATADEVLALAAVCRAFPGTSLELLPGPIGPFEPGKVERMAAMSRAARRPINWNVMFPDARNMAECRDKVAATVAASVDGARIVGLAIDRGTSPPMRLRAFNLVPGLRAVLQLGDADLLSRLGDPAGRLRIAEALASAPPYLGSVSDWSLLRVEETFSARSAPARGRLVGDLAKERGTTPVDVVCDLVAADTLRTVVRFEPPPDTRADWAARVELWRTPATLVGGSDAGAHVTRNVGFAYPTRLLAEAVRRHGLLDLEEAVQLLTSRPADLVGLVGRGRISEGARADLVVFDEAEVGPAPVRIVDDLPGGASRLYAEATGIGHVVVAGEEIVRDGTFTDARPGRVLRSGSDTRTPSWSS